MKVAVILALLGLVLAVQASKSSSGDRDMSMGSMLKKLLGKRGSGSKSESSEDSEEKRDMDLKELLKMLNKKFGKSSEESSMSQDEDEECEERKKKMEEHKRKQMFEEQLRNASMRLEQERHILTHGVTFEIVSNCECVENSMMVRQYFEHKFGDLSYKEKFEAYKKMVYGDSVFSKENVMETMENMTMGNMANNDTSTNSTTTAPTVTAGANSTYNPTSGEGETSVETSGETSGEHTFMERQAEKISKMSQEEIFKHMFNDMVGSMCKAARSYMRGAMKVEKAFAAWKYEHSD